MFNFKLPKEGKNNVIGLNGELEALYINNIYKNEDSDIFIVTGTIYEANKIYNVLTNYNDNVYLFPMDDFITSEASISSPELMITRLETLNDIAIKRTKKIVIANLMGALRFLPLERVWKESIINLSINQEFSKDDLYRKLCNIGYEPVSLVTKTGEVSNRGYILDIFPINEDNPVRIEFWGDNIESIRGFDIDSQLSNKELKEIRICPFSEFITKSEIENDQRKQKYLDKYETTSSINKYLKSPIIIFKDYNQIINSYNILSDEIIDYNKANQETCKYMNDFSSLYSEKVIYASNVSDILQDIKIDNTEKYDCYYANNYNDNFELLERDLIKYVDKGYTVIICLKNSHQATNIMGYLNIKMYNTSYDNIHKNSVNIIVKNISEGYIFDNYVVLGEKNLFKSVEDSHSYKSKFKYGTKISRLDSLNAGDYVVHNMHGIGRYVGIIAINKNGVIKDYLQIDYKDNDKLYIPVEKIELISKYSSNESIVPKINKLGSLEWEKTKLRIKSRLKSIALELMTIAAERKLIKGFAFRKDVPEQAVFESEFMYSETTDQLKATEAIKTAMEQEYPMDMLLCGDVGYGKTEVAFRAIFKAVCSSKQVAYLCPTTILSNQQYLSALSRFKNFPINIALLNRFTTKKEAEKIISNLKAGKIDILFGTHRILSKDIVFKDLGFLVIDEEQRFGVEQKEKIKKYKANIDILTLSATPIPRTLQMSMVGIRNLVLIETPPNNRYPIQTYVLEENSFVIKDAIFKELSRGGQVYILCNKISEFENKINEIKKLIPEIRIGYAHGKMNKSEIENVMMKFISKEFNILLCTTIIETGIDIPNVNTLIIIDADNFGLSQLYQIRGRVGRTNKVAYAYLMYNKRKILSDVATKRLSAIKEFTKLGSGFSIAMRDLSIRGAGDILGREQSGFIDSVGIELYIKMLNDEVKKLQGIEVEEDQDEEPPLINVATHIEDSYVSDDNLKIEIHRKINKIKDYDSLYKIKEELEDRFGKINDEMLIYMYEEWFENLRKQKGIEKVNQTEYFVELIFNEEKTNSIKADELFIKSYEVSHNFKLAYSNRRLKLILRTKDLEKHWIHYIVDLLNII